MRFFVTGGRGFIGRNVKECLEEQGHEVVSPTSEELDLLKPIDLDEKFDAIVHCAIKGGRRDISDSPTIVYENIAMFQHVWDLHKKSGSRYFFNIGSGAEEDRKRDVRNMTAPLDIPTDFYGLSKRTIHECFKHDHTYVNLRAYGVFGKYEEPQRFIRTALENYRDGKNITIHAEKRMDFFYVKDIAVLIEKITESPIEFGLPDNSLNLSYNDRILYLGDIARYINTLDDHEVGIRYRSSVIGRDYYGSVDKLEFICEHVIEHKLTGFKQAIKEYYEQLR